MSITTEYPPGVFRLEQPTETNEPAFPYGFGRDGVHEVCEAGYGDLTALTGFAFAMIPKLSGVVAWVSQSSISFEHGGLRQTGLRSLGWSDANVLRIETCKTLDALWAIEEAICSATIGLVIAEIQSLDFTASRRLTLASRRYGVPVVLLQPYAAQGATAANSRWRVQPTLSGPNRHDHRGLGNPRWLACLERSRLVPSMSGKTFELEWNNETLSVDLVSRLVPDTSPSKHVEGSTIWSDTFGRRRA